MVTYVGNSNVSNSTDNEDFHRITLVRGYISVVVLLFCLVVLTIAVVNLRNHVRKLQGYPHRCLLFLFYLTSPFFLLAVSSLLPALSYTLVVSEADEPITEEYCRRGPAYLIQWFESAETLAILAFSLYFTIYHIPHFNRLPVSEQEPLLRDHSSKRFIKRYSVTSFLLFLAIYIVSGIYNLPPLFNDGYGKAGPWCWFQDHNDQLHYWFIEAWIFEILSFIVLNTAFILICCVTTPLGERRRCLQNVKWEKTILVPFGLFYMYFILHFAFTIAEVVVRVTKVDKTALWYTYAVLSPLSILMVVISSVVLMSTIYRRMLNKPSMEIGGDCEASA